MAKIYGLFGSMQGKVADVVMAVRNGEQIVRKYQPIVSNPKTAAQTAARAKLKLLSQLGAALQPVVAVPRVGMVSPRNGFTQANYPNTTFADENASIYLEKIQLTKSAIPLGTMNIDDDGKDVIEVGFLDDLSTSVDAVVYVVIRQTRDGKVAVATSKLVREAGVEGKFETTLPKYNADVAVLAYGIRYNTITAREVFGSITVPSAEGVAKLITSRILKENDAAMTETIGLFVAQS